VKHRWAVAGFSLRRPGFDPRSGYVGFVLSNEALDVNIFPHQFGFFYKFSFHKFLHIY
jgi:hypothetical protein